MTKKEVEAKLKSDSAIVVDIREGIELTYDPGIKGSQHIPAAAFVEMVKSGQIDKSKEIVTVCQSGTRCEFLTGLLRSSGYTVGHLDGGLVFC